MHLHASAPMHTEPRSTTLFPYTTLFRSNLRGEEQPVMDNISRRSFLMFATGAISAPHALPPWPEIAEVPRLLDHILLGSNDLDRGIAFVEEHTGVRAAFGGVHPGRGTDTA